MRWFRRDVQYVALGALMVTSFLFGPIFRGQMPLPQGSLAGILTGQPDRDVTNSIWRDRSVQAWPYHQFAVEAIQAGRLPLWNNLVFAGTPFFANGQAGIFSPFKVLFWSLPDWLSFNLITILQSVVAGLGMYLLGRTLGWKKPASVTAAATLILSAPFVMRLTVLSMSAVVACLPWLLLSITRLQQTLRWKWAAATAGAVAAAILAGHAQLAVLIVAYGVLWTLLSWKNTDWKRRVLQLSTAFTVGVMLGGVMILPMKESLDHAYREPKPTNWSKILTWKNLTRVSVKQAAGLATMLDQNILGSERKYRGPANYLEGNLYVGIVAAILALVSVVTWRDRRWWGTVVLAGLFAIFIVFPGTWQVMGKLVPWLSVTPVWRISFLLAFSVALLAGWGMNYVAGKWTKKWIWTLPAAAVTLSLWQWQGILPFTSRDMLFPPSEFMQTVKATVGDGKLWPTHGALDQYMPYDIPVIFGYDSVYPKEYLELFEANAELRQRNQLHARNIDSGLLNVVGTSALLTRDPVPDDFLPVAKSGPYTLAKKYAVFPPFRTVQQVMQSDDPADISKIDPRYMALVSGTIPNVDLAASTVVTVQERTATKASALVKTSGSTVLVTNMQHYPGWKLTIDGREAAPALLKVNHAFLGAAVNEGQHTVTFEYRPKSFQYGLVLSLAGVIGLAYMFWLDRRQNKIPAA